MTKSKYPELENPEDQERAEYHARRSLGECTCDLLSPFGHVTCKVCNNWDGDDWILGE